MLKPGEKLLIVHRRLFEKDLSRFFIGEVQAYETGIVKVKGYTFVKDLFSGNMRKKSDLRTKVLSLVSGTLIVYQLPVTGLLDWMKFSLDPDGALMLTDGRGFWMDLSEIMHTQEQPERI
jgi:hypothetical protein